MINNIMNMINKYTLTTSHKIIGILYGYMGYIAGILGYIISMLIRMELNTQGLSIVRKVKEVTIYNNWITIHGLIMLFVFIMPIGIGYYGNYLIPMLIGTSELSMPRMNGISFWMLIVGVVIFVISNVLMSKPISSGWTLWDSKCINLTQCWNIQIINILTIIYVLIINHVFNNSLVVKIINNGQSAGFYNTNNNNIKSSETQRQDTNINRLALKKNKELFYQWLVGLVDGDGCFSITKNKHNNSYQFTFKIALHKTNIKLLYLIKKILKCGSVTYAGNNKWQYRIRDRKTLQNIIIPIFNDYPMFTKKQYNFELFYKALSTPNTVIINKCHNDYINTRIDTFNPSKPYIIGFIEAEGSFYITRKNKYVHGFGITQKYDQSLLEFIRKELGIVAKVRYNNKGFWSLDTTNKRNIEYIIKYFNNTLLGCKHIEFILWSKSFKNSNIRNNDNKMKLLQDKMRALRK
jgi:hypothetical protein